MPINIDPAALRFVAEVEHTCGMPTLADPEQNEQFGPYTNEVAWAFLTYDAGTKRWGMVESHNRREPFPIKLARDPNLTPEHQLDLEDAMIVGDMMHLPADPADQTIRSSLPPFLFMGWRLAWTFLPELRRWEIAPLGRA